ncbi:MAG: hypothetical protein WCX61_04500 [Candidatus Peribacteraceae bacterium]|jgi:hypothetical protein
MRLYAAISGICAALLTLCVPVAYALDFSGLSVVVDSVSGTSGASFSDNGFGTIFETIASAFVPLVYITAVFIVAKSALLLVVEQSEGQLGQFKQSIVSAIVAVVLIYLAGALKDALFAGVGVVPSVSAADKITEEFQGIVDLIEEPLAVIAVTMIIVSGIRTVMAYGSSDGMTHLRRTVFSVLTGIVLIVSKFAISQSLTETHTPDPIIAVIVSIMVKLLTFVTIVAVVVVIWSGLLMIVNVGNDAQYQQAKGILIRVIIGIFVILSASAIAYVMLGDGAPLLGG